MAQAGDILTVGALIARGARDWPRRPALRLGAQSATHAELEALTRRCARALMAHGIGPGDRVGLFLPNCWEDMILLHGLGLIGLVLFVASWVSPFTALLQRQINWHDNAAYTIAVVPGLCMTYAAGAYLLVPFQASWLSLWLPLALLLARLSERPAIRPNSR